MKQKWKLKKITLVLMNTTQCILMIIIDRVISSTLCQSLAHFTTRGKIPNKSLFPQINNFLSKIQLKIKRVAKANQVKRNLNMYLHSAFQSQIQSQLNKENIRTFDSNINIFT